MRVVVTGGLGFIGSNFIHHLLHQDAGVPSKDCCPEEARYPPSDSTGCEVLNLDAQTYAADPTNLDGVNNRKDYAFSKVDICEPTAVERSVGKFEPDTVVHFAAESHVDRSIESGRAFAKTNVVGTQVLLDAARRHDVSRFVHVSTDEVYGSIEKGSFTESSPLHPASPYSASKAGSDLLALAHHRTYGLRVTVVRCTNNYGPRQNSEKLVPKMITRALRNERLPVYAKGQNVRDWLHVKDACAAIRLLQEKGKAGEVYNVAGRNELANLEIVRRILKLVKRPESLIEFVADRPGHDWRYSVDDSKMRGFGWAPRTSFEVGLQETVDWYRVREPAVRAK